jgi:glycosyltransferase involved in cell wall biosynthesis
MRVVYVCADPGVPVFGCKGASNHVQEIVRAMVRRGLEVVLVARRTEGPIPPGLESASVVPLRSIEARGGAERERALMAADREVRELLAALDPVGLVYQRHSLWSCAGLEHARDAAIPSVLEVNAPLVEEQARFRDLFLREDAEAIERRAFAAAGRIACVSHPVAEYCVKRGADPARVLVVPNGVDPARFRPDVPAALQPEAGTIRVGMVSTLRPWHGVDPLVEAFSRVADGDRRWRLLIVGDGPSMQSLRDDLSHRGLLDRAVVTGAVPAEMVPAWLTSMDIAAAPYRASADHYFSPLKLFEYMAAGRAIVASRIGQVASVIEDGRTGVLCEPGDVGEMAGALKRLGDDPAERARLGRAARECAAREHSWDNALGRALHGLVDGRECTLMGARR